MLIYNKLFETLTSEHNRVVLFLGLNMLKMLFSLVLLAVYCFTIKELIMPMVIAFVLNYFIYMAIDVKSWNVCRGQTGASLIKEVNNEVA